MRYLGGGHKKRYRIIDFKRTKTGIPAEVKSIEYDPMKLDLIAPVTGGLHTDQRQVGCPTSNVTHQNQLSGMNEVWPVAAVSIDPGVKGGLWFFDQINASEPRLPGCLDRQFPCDLIEGRRQRDDDVLLIKRIFPVRVIPRGA